MQKIYQPFFESFNGPSLLPKGRSNTRAEIMKKILYWTFVIFNFINCTRPTQEKLIFEKLLCESAENPIYINTYQPHFTWIVKSPVHNQYQQAYQLYLASSKEALEREDGNIWTSNKVNSDQTMHVRYGGKPLESNKTYFWKVKIWDKENNEFVSRVEEFTTTLMSSDDWNAKWIGFNDAYEPRPLKGFFMDQKEEHLLNDTVYHHGRSVLLRKTFHLDKKISSARLFISGLGFYEAKINGSRVGEQMLSPAKTPYHKHILFDTYEVTSLMRQGNNAIGIHLGNGWYNPYKKWWKEYRMQWFGYKKAIAQLHIEYEDGESEKITTDQTWKASEGPVLYNCVYDGEVYDANEEKEGWSKSQYDDSMWKDAVLMKFPEGKLIAQQMPPIKIHAIRKPLEVTEPKAGMVVFDLGQNFTGWINLKLKGRKGTKITIKHSEELYEDGTLNFTCNENAEARVEYILKGENEEIYQPAFSYFGFQFVEITSSGEMPEIVDLEGHVIYSANDRVGNFSCSHDLINKMHHATVWSQMSNMLSYPMDCPQRDERLGWMGDAQVTAEEAMFNFDMANFYENWFMGIRANQDESGDIPIISPRPYIRDEGIEWSSSYITMVWNHYLYYGDSIILKDNYSAMVSYLDYLTSIADNHILPKGWIGDWGSMVEGWKEGEPESTPTAYYFYNATILTKVAKILGEEQDARHFEKLSIEIKNAYNSQYFDQETKDYNDGSQMANGFPLYLGLVKQEYEQVVLEHLVQNIVEENDTHLTTGVLGTKYLIEALSKYGRSDIAWALATQTTYPSWAEMMKRFNTMCEFWTLKQSHNHVMMGSIDAWFYKVLAGIQLDEQHPGFKEFSIRPFIAEGLDHVEASTSTLRGEIKVNWHGSEDEFNLEAVIPFNTKAIVYIPGNKEDHLQINESNILEQPLVEILDYQDGYHALKVPSGSWNFTLKQ
jgi:alpha-L-rhamnosidase